LLSIQRPIDVTRRHRHDQLVDGVVVEQLLDRVHRVMPRRDEASTDTEAAARIAGSVSWSTRCAATSNRTTIGPRSARARTAAKSSSEAATRSVMTRTSVGSCADIALPRSLNDAGRVVHAS
jgi:hypothetical protein